VGVNLIPLVRNFRIDLKTFSPGDCAVQEGCAVPGPRKLLRFDFLSWNAGTMDLVMGAPSQRQQLYVWSPCHGHWHLRDFNTFKLFDCTGVVRTGAKQAFCLIDIVKIDPKAGPRKFNDCNSNQGVTAGWADLYNAALDCQWVDITGVADGDYTLEAWTNRNAVVSEDSYGDNLTWAGIRISGNVASEIAPPCYPEDCVGFSPLKVKAARIAGSWKVVDGGHWLMDFGSKAAAAKTAVKVIRAYKMDTMCFVGRPSRSQLMTYFKSGNQIPTGPLPGEDALPFDPNQLSAVQANGRWKVTEGSRWMLDFGSSQANALKAVALLKKYQFRYECFVGRPNAPMMYFRR
jgi:hypothetical protein